MLFSYTLLFAMLTTFVAAAPTPTSDRLESSKPKKITELPAEGLPIMDAADYLTMAAYRCWTRVPLPNVVHPEDPMVICFKKDTKSGGPLLYNKNSLGLDLSDATVKEMNLETSDMTSVQGLGGYWYQTETNRMMKITLEDGKYHISPLGNHDPGPKDRISIAKPEGEVKITDPMAAYYLAAAGGTWAKSSNLDENRVKKLSFDIELQQGRHGLVVQQHYNDGLSGGVQTAKYLTNDAVGSGLIGEWVLEPKVLSVKPATIKIEYTRDAFPIVKESSV